MVKVKVDKSGKASVTVEFDALQQVLEYVKERKVSRDPDAPDADKKPLHPKELLRKQLQQRLELAAGELIWKHAKGFDRDTKADVETDLD